MVYRRDGGIAASLLKLMTAALLCCCLFLPSRAQSNGGLCAAPDNTTGSPCGGAGPASQGNTSGTQQGAGNPINLITGNKYQREVDMAPLPGVLGLELIRHYNSSSSGPRNPTGIMGRGWKLSYETEIVVSGPLLRVREADGTVLVFVRIPDGNYVATNPGYGRITAEHQPRGTEYTWTWTDGRRLMFNMHGKLAQIVAPTGEFVSLLYDPDGILLRVTDPQGRQLRLNYPGRATISTNGKQQFNGVQHIDSPVGRFSYEYGSELAEGGRTDQTQVAANLVKVRLPTNHDREHRVHPWTERGVTASSISRIYHYENNDHPTLLTGITVQGQGGDGQPMLQRLATWAYDNHGRARLSVKGERSRFERDKDGKLIEPTRIVAGTGIEEVAIRWPSDGEVQLTNSLGQITYYKTALIAGENRILEARGPGCASCGPTNIRYRYDAQGRLIEETALSSDGAPLATTRTERDTQGRMRRVGLVHYRNGRPQPPQWLVRYEYGTGLAVDQPILIARPSIVPGKEHQLVIAYNDKGQVERITETGYSPLDADERPLVFAREAGRVRAISRTTRYTYQIINGRSLLTEIDGPLPNGPTNSPQDSDIHRAEWDSNGDQIVSWTQPGGFKSAIAHAAGTGYIAKVTDADGTATSFSYDARGQLVQTRRTGAGWNKPHVQTYKYDALGHSTEKGTGSEADKSYVAQLRRSFDVAGNLQWKASPLGILEQQRYDSESRLIETGRYSASMEQVQRYDYDPLGRLIRLTDNKGSGVAIGYDALGGSHIMDALGRVRYPETTAKETEAASVRNLRDDFGRVVATLSPDSGITVRRFDAADRLIAGMDAERNHAEYTYDAAGRIARQVVADHATGKATVTEWHYVGKRLTSVEHPTQSERYRYDPRGFLVAKTVILKRDGQHEFISRTHYDYDEDGRLRSTSLPDGSSMLYERNGQGQVVALKRSRIRTPWLRWLLPSQTIVENIERDIVGLKRYSTGNHIEAAYQRSREGVLARVSYRSAGPESGVPAQSATGTVVSKDDKLLATAANRSANQLPGALGLPFDRQSFLDYRYLWDVRGNLLYAQGKGEVAATNSYAYDGQDRLITAVAQTDRLEHVSRYFYDDAGNRVLSQQGAKSQSETSAGTQKTVYQPGTHRWMSDDHQSADYNGNGQPRRIARRNYVWDALGRLVQVGEGNALLARYVYNHRGERIAKEIGAHTVQFLYEDGKLAAELNRKGEIVRQYVYLSEQPVALVDALEGKALHSEETSAISEALTDIGTAIRVWSQSDEAIVWLHANHLGAIEIATNEQGQKIWQVRYGAYGQIEERVGTSKSDSPRLNLNLRLPGQYEDVETGLYYNGQRYYDPGRGRYLTPDPLGTMDGPNPYAYVRGNPQRYVDPSGLVLFAFDGTGNTNDQRWLLANDSSLSNVWEFRQRYQERRRYISGVGTVHHDEVYGDITPSMYTPSWMPLGDENADLGGNYSGPSRIERMVRYFNDEAGFIADNSTMEVDIVGFSRGASEARDFANRAVGRTRNGWYSYVDDQGGNHCQKVHFRFMGLFDTVLSTNFSGKHYNLAVTEDFDYVAHAVALNEHRDNLLHPYASIGAFPGESIMPGMYSSTQALGKTRIERGFLGSHADIGGGFGQYDSQLARVALTWMVDQAKRAGVPISSPTSKINPRPVIHDKSDSILVGAPGPIPNELARQYRPAGMVADGRYRVISGSPGAISEDRIVRYRDGTTVRQRRMSFSTGMTWADTAQFIQYLPKDDPQRRRFITGTVNMQSYLEWLNKSGYNIDLTVEGS